MGQREPWRAQLATWSRVVLWEITGISNCRETEKLQGFEPEKGLQNVLWRWRDGDTYKAYCMAPSFFS